MKCDHAHISNWQTGKAAARVIVIAGSCLLSACASLGFGGPETEIDTTPTGSIGSGSSLLAGIAPSDWQILLDTVGTLDKQSIDKDEQAISWDNPETGSKGEITSVSSHKSVMNEECRSFKSSMHRITGVENVVGEICRDVKGEWQITGFSSGTAA
ncbi:MAG: RT0821/Lpp0805 family surface protein [Cohaesibacter sp.]|nr:RT0821/Lpp0805 family surface protein [Cohaesibacter sp.]